MSRRSFLVFPFAFPLAFDPDGKVVRKEMRTAEGFAEALPGGALMEMIGIPSGPLLLPNGRETVVSAFSMGRGEVTIAQWNAVAKWHKQKHDLPVLKTGKESAYGWQPEQAAEMVAFHDCAEFCLRLSKHTGKTYRLPTDHEWEYACRAGTRTEFWWGRGFSPFVAVEPKENDAPKAPGSTGFANAFGLFDTVGNVDEWVADADPKRGDFHAFHTTAGEKDWLSEKLTRTGLGFRVACEAAK